MTTIYDEQVSDERGVAGPIYVFEVPVRIWHWLHALAIATLIVSGYLIAVPLPSVSGEASDHFLMGYIRFAHFTAAFVFAIALIVRFYLAFVGNKYSRELFIVPIWSGKWWRGLWHEIKFYTFVTRKTGKHIGHNPLAQFAMWLANIALALFMICTGFALYSQGTGAGSWADTLFGWVFVVEASSQTVRMWHLMGMWLMLVFIIIHVYMAIRAGVASRQNGTSAMIDGWRRFKDDGPLEPQ